MTSLATDIRDLIAQRVMNTTAAEVINIVDMLCSDKPPLGLSCGIEPQWEVVDEVWNFDRASGLYMSRYYTDSIKRNWQGCVDSAARFTPMRPGMICRAPTLRERLRAVDYTRRNPAINKDLFKGEADWEWTGTLLANSDGSPSEYAWRVDCNVGGTNDGNQNGGGFVRAVCVSQ